MDGRFRSVVAHYVIHSSSINPKPSSFSAVGCGKRCLESAVDYRSMNHGTRQCQGTNTRESRQAPSRAFLRVVTQTEDVLIDRAGPRNAAWCRCGHYLCMQNAMMVPTRTSSSSFILTSILPESYYKQYSEKV